MNRINEDTGAERPANWPAVPALVALAACVALTMAVVWAGATPDVTTLSMRAEQATAAQDHRTAILYHRHLLAIQPDRPAHALNLARSIDRTGQRGEAIQVLTAVAPLAGGGYGPAHLQVAEWLVGQRVLHGTGDRATWDLAARHAKAAQADPSTRSAASGLLEIIEGVQR